MRSVRPVLALFSVWTVLFLTACAASPNDAEGIKMTGAYEDAAPSDAAALTEWNTEEYGAIDENGFRPAASAPLSTFAAEVDTASYSNVRRMLLAGEDVPADAVRIEEMINYFHYDYPQPDGDDPFSIVTELGNCPWNEETKLLLIGLQAKEIALDALPRSNLVFLLDVSGSMRDRLPLLKQAFHLLSESLNPEDVVSIVTYAGADRVVLDGASGAERAVIDEALDSLSAGGGTAGAKGIETAYEIARKHFIKNGNNRILLATDGDLNIGVSSEGELIRLVEKRRDSGVFLSVLGFGTGNLKDNKMEALADHGNGVYAYIDSILEARRVLVEQLGGTLTTVAKDVKIQVEFNPAKLKGYRLIGYENRLLNDEDFADDTKDAGEIGAGHRVTALYELVAADSRFEVRGAPALRYQKPAESAGVGGEWLTVSIRYQPAQGGESRLLTRPVDGEFPAQGAPPNLDFAAGVAQFGMLLRGSEYAGESSYDGIIERLGARPDVKDDDYKAEFMELVRRTGRQRGATD